MFVPFPRETLPLATTCLLQIPSLQVRKPSCNTKLLPTVITLYIALPKSKEFSALCFLSHLSSDPVFFIYVLFSWRWCFVHLGFIFYFYYEKAMILVTVVSSYVEFCAVNFCNIFVIDPLFYKSTVFWVFFE